MCNNIFSIDECYKLNLQHKDATLIKNFSIDFVYENDYKKNKLNGDASSCLELGFKFKPTTYFQSQNFVMQMKRKGLSESYKFHVFYLKSIREKLKNKGKSDLTIVDITSDFDGYLIIGLKPYEYNPTSYNHQEMRSVPAVFGVDIRNWGIHFNEISYFSPKTSEKILINSNNEIYLNFTSPLNIFPKFIYETLKNHVLNEYINKGICHESIKDNKYATFYFDKSKVNVKELKNAFNFEFLNQNLEFTFKQTSDDLLVEIDDKIFLLIYFEIEYDYIKLTLGRPFLEKYMFEYDFDANLLTFYATKLQGDEIRKRFMNEKNYINSSFRFSYFSLIIFLLLAVLALGILIGKKYCLKHKKRINVPELDDDYNYQLNEKYVGDLNKNLEMSDKNSKLGQ